MTPSPARTGSPAKRDAPFGVRLRVGTRADDLPGLAELRTRCNEADGTEDVYTLAVLQNEIEHASGWDPAEDQIVAEREGAIVGWARVSVALMATGEQVFECVVRVHPDHRGQGIGRALLRRAEARARQRALVEPHDGRRLIAAFATDTATGAEHLYQSEGYTAVRYFFHMLREDLEDLATPALPEGIEVHPVRDDEILTIFDAVEEAFRDDWMEAVQTEEDRRRYLGDPGTDPARWQVGWHGDEVAGIVFPAVDAAANARYGRRRVLLDAVAVRRPFRRRGLATALMLRALHAARDSGMTSADLWVDTANVSGALRVYERLGFRAALRSTAYHKDLQ